VKRALIAAVALASLAAGSAFAFENNSDYSGGIKGTFGHNVGFSIERSASGHKRVTDFNVTNLPITCSDSGETTSTGGYNFPGPMRVRHHEFSGKGDWEVFALDPSGPVAGKFKPGGKAAGTLKLHGELAGPGTHCHTGPLEWKATKNPPV
jgi:hypothetical protein